MTAGTRCKKKTLILIVDYERPLLEMLLKHLLAIRLLLVLSYIPFVSSLIRKG